MEIKGKIIHISALQEFDKSSKREVVIETEDKYPQEIAVEFWSENTGVVEDMSIGEPLTVRIALKGRAWQNPETKVTRWFLSASVLEVVSYDRGDTGKTVVDANVMSPAGGVTDDIDQDVPF